MFSREWIWLTAGIQMSFLLHWFACRVQLQFVGYFQSNQTEIFYGTKTTEQLDFTVAITIPFQLFFFYRLLYRRHEHWIAVAWLLLVGAYMSEATSKLTFHNFYTVGLFKSQCRYRERKMCRRNNGIRWKDKSNWYCSSMSVRGGKRIWTSSHEHRRVEEFPAVHLPN